MFTEFPDAESPEQARIASERAGRVLTPEAFRKQADLSSLELIEHGSHSATESSPLRTEDHDEIPR